MATGDRSYITNNDGELSHVDIDTGNGQTERWETYGPGSETPAELVAVQDHKDGDFRECSGYHILTGEPAYK